MEYNIGFVIGDPSGDGHACTTDYHIVANHSADEISKAYKETTKLLGFDLIKEVGVDFQSDYWIPEKFTKELLKLGIIDEKYVRESDAEWGAPAGCYEFDYAEEEFVDLYFAIVKYSLPDLEWSSRDLEEETLWDLYGADDVQGMEFDLTPLELRDLIGKPNWVPTKFLGWRTWKTSVYFKIII